MAILPSALEQIIEISQRERLHGDELVSKLEAVAAKLGRPLDNTRTVTARNGVAIIPIDGPITRHASLFSDISGGTSTEVIATDLQTALEDNQIHTILLAVDSPGGESAGIGELAELVYKATLQKPVVAYVSSMGASAAYWLAAAASELVISPSAILGSIGTVMVHTDTSARDAKSGIKRLEIVSSQSPHKRPDMNTDKGLAQVQSMLDSLTDVFVEAIAGYRETTVDHVLSEFGQGGVKVGQDAVDAGMADRIGTFEEVLAELASDPNGSREKLVRVPKPKVANRPAPQGKKPMAKSWKERMLAMINGAPDDFDPIGSSAEVIEPTAILAATPLKLYDPEMAKLKADFSRVEAALVASQADAKATWEAKNVTDAASFVASHASRIYSRERESLTNSLTQAALDDRTSPLATGSRLATLQTAITARPPHGLLTEHVGNAPLPNGLKTLNNSVTTDPNVVDPTAVKQYLAMHQSGREILRANGGELPNDPLMTYRY